MKLTKAIITALPLEAELIIKKYALKENKTLWSLKIYCGTRINPEDQSKEDIVLMILWEGKIQSAFATTYLMENYDVTKVVNIWVVWNLNPEVLKIGDVILPNTFIQHDFYMPKSIDFHKDQRAPIFLEYAVWEEYDFEKFSLHLSGICATGDQFVDTKEHIEDIRNTFEADIVDMEAYSILAILRNYDVLDKAVVIKSVSDWADDSAVDDVMKNLNAAMHNAVAILDFVL